MSEEINELLLKNFDVKKLNGCSVHECKAKPSKSILYRAFHLKKHVVKDLGKFYLCEAHLEKAKDLIKEMNSISMKDWNMVRADVSGLNEARQKRR